MKNFLIKQSIFITIIHRDSIKRIFSKLFELFILFYFS